MPFHSSLNPPLPTVLAIVDGVNIMQMMTIGAVSDTIGMIRLYRHDTIRPWTYRRHRPFRRRYQFPRWCIV